MNITRIKDFFLKFEPLIFFIIICVNLYPIFSGKYFSFMDAPAHLYNADLVRQMAFGHNSFLESYMKFNSVLVPNWLCHIIMAPLLLFFSTNVTEKILLSCFFVGLPVAARYCLATINKNQRYIALLIIPFTYNFLSMIAFYNFSLGLVFMFFTIGYFYKNFLGEDVKWHNYLLLFLLLLTTYLCHIVVLGITILYLSLIYLWHLVYTFNFDVKKWFSTKTIKLILVIIPVIVLMGIYYKSFHASSKDFNFLSNQELFNYFKDARMLTVFNGNEEQNYSNFIALFYIATVFIAVYLFIINLSKDFYKKITFYFLLATLLLLFLYLILPDSDGLAGFVSIRISMLVFILCILFISASSLNHKFIIPLCALIIFIHFKRLPYYKDVIKQNSLIAESVVEQSKLVEANSFILPFKFDADNWLSGHYSNYLCLGKPVICFENYECGTGYFPLIWKDRDLMWNLQQSLSNFQNIESIKKQINQTPVYYWILGDLTGKTDSVSIKFKLSLTDNCLLINSTKFATLYKLK